MRKSTLNYYLLMPFHCVLNVIVTMLSWALIPSHSNNNPSGPKTHKTKPFSTFRYLLRQKPVTINKIINNQAGDKWKTKLSLIGCVRWWWLKGWKTGIRFHSISFPFIFRVRVRVNRNYRICYLILFEINLLWNFFFAKKKESKLQSRGNGIEFWTKKRRK